jgi:hypothetical protein
MPLRQTRGEQMGSIRASWISVTQDSLMLMLVDLSNRVRQRRFAVYLMFALCLFSAAAIAVFELGMMRAETPERWGQLLRWVHLPLTLLMISLVLFVRMQFRACRRGWTLPLIAIPLAALAANFLTGANLEFRQITALRPLDGAIGVHNPWIILIGTYVALMAAFLIDTMRTVRRHGDTNQQEKVVPICLSILVFVLLAGTWEFLVAYGLIVGPLFVALPFLGISLVLAYVIGSDALHVGADHSVASKHVVSLVECRRRPQRRQQACRFSGRIDAIFGPAGRFARLHPIRQRARRSDVLLRPRTTERNEDRIAGTGQIRYDVCGPAREFRARPHGAYRDGRGRMVGLAQGRQ